MKEQPDNPGLFFKYATVLLHQEHFRLSACLYRCHLLLNKNEYYGLCWLANALSNDTSANDKKAESMLMRAINRNPCNPLAHIGLGLLHKRNVLKLSNQYRFVPGSQHIVFNNERSAEDYLSGKPKRNFSMGDGACGNRNIAISALNKAFDQCDDPEDKVNILFWIAEVECTQSNEKAIQTYEQILHLSPDNRSARLHLLGCYATIEDTMKTLEYYHLIQDDSPELEPEARTIMNQFKIAYEL